MRLINFLKSLFIKKNKVTENEKPICIFDKFFDLDVDINCGKKQQQMFDCIQEGDLVYAKMPLSEDELNKIPKGHRARPYYIAYKLNNGFIAFQCSSKRNRHIPSIKTYLILGTNKNKLNKDCHINLMKPYYLPKTNVTANIISTNNFDYDEINRRLYLTYKTNYLNLYKLDDYSLIVKPGDIVKKGNKYWLILERCGDLYKAINVYGDDRKRGTIISCNTKQLKCNDKYISEIKIDSSCKIKEIVNRNDLFFIYNKINNINNKKVKPISNNKEKQYFLKHRIGTVLKDISSKDEYVYLFSNKEHEFGIKVNEYLYPEIYPLYDLYLFNCHDVETNGEVTDEELYQILSDQIKFGNDKCNILLKKFNKLKEVLCTEQ